jgi:hypothetical protein
MKTIKKKDVYERVDDATAESKVKHNGWSYSSKSEWKAKTRKPKEEAVVEKKVKNK